MDYGTGYVPPVAGKDSAGHEYLGGDVQVTLIACDLCRGLLAIGCEKQHELTNVHKLAYVGG